MSHAKEEPNLAAQLYAIGKAAKQAELDRQKPAQEAEHVRLLEKWAPYIEAIKAYIDSSALKEAASQLDAKGEPVQEVSFDYSHPNDELYELIKVFPEYRGIRLKVHNNSWRRSISYQVLLSWANGGRPTRKINIRLR